MQNLILSGLQIPLSRPVSTYKDTRLDFKPSWQGCEKRHQKITHIVLHWTGGEGGGKQVYRTLKSRGLAVEFFIDAEGTIYQYADPSRVACRAVGNEFWKRSISIEIQNFGFRRDVRQVPPKALNRGCYQDKIHGINVTIADFYPAQKQAIKELTKKLCDHFGIAFSCAVDDDGELIKRRLKNAERDKVGVLGHFHLTNRKVDPGTQIFHDLFQIG